MTSLGDRLKTISAPADNDAGKATLLRMANLAMQVSYQTQGVQQTARLREDMVLIIEEGVDPVRAMLFAKEHRSEGNLCRLVFLLGESQYEQLHECVQMWGEGFLAFAFEKFL